MLTLKSKYHETGLHHLSGYNNLNQFTELMEIMEIPESQNLLPPR